MRTLAVPSEQAAGLIDQQQVLAGDDRCRGVDVQRHLTGRFEDDGKRGGHSRWRDNLLWRRLTEQYRSQSDGSEGHETHAPVYARPIEGLQ